MTRPTRSCDDPNDAAAAANDERAERARRLIKRHQEAESASPPPPPSKKAKTGTTPPVQRRPKSKVVQVEFSPEFAATRTDRLAASEVDPNSNASKIWFEMLEKLKDYKTTTGNCNVPLKYPDDLQLANWVRTQRKRYSTRQMPEWKVTALNDLGFEWRLKESNSVWATGNIKTDHEVAADEVIAITEDGEDNNINVTTVTGNTPSSSSPNKTPKNKGKPRCSSDFQKRWDVHFEKLVAFHEQHGHWNVPQTYPEDQTFSNWVRTQRDNYNYENRASVPEHRVAKLNSIGFDWKTPVNRVPQKSWAEMYDQLASYHAKNGTIQSLDEGKRTVLASWMAKQRAAYHRDPREITPEQISQLEELGMDWTKSEKTIPAGKKRRWEDFYMSLKQFVQEHGNLDVLESDRSLYSWMVYQRRAYHTGRLSSEQIGQLEELAFDFSEKPKISKWQGHYNKFKEWKATNGDLEVPIADESLLKWADYQRKSYHSKRLSPEQIELLNAIGFDFGDPPKSRWQEQYDKFKEWKATNGDIGIPMATDRSVLQWASYQRKAYHLDQLSPERIERLNAVGFDFGPPPPKPPTWDEMFHALGEFLLEKGHTNVPPKYKANPALGSWVANQKELYHQEKLEENQIKQLEAYGFDWTLSPTPFSKHSWDENYEALKAFQDATGHANPTALYEENPDLCVWVARQRHYATKGKLSEDKVAKLTSIGFDWSGPRRYKFSKEEIWLVFFRKLKKFQQEYGHCGTIDELPDSALMDWIGRQHVHYLKRKLDDDKIRKLESIGFEWRYDVDDDDDDDDDGESDGDQKMPATPSYSRGPRVSWAKHLSRLREFHEKYNSWNVPKKYDGKLAQWVQDQRKARINDKLAPERADKLTEIGFTWEQQPPLDENLVEPRVPPAATTGTPASPEGVAMLADAAVARTQDRNVDVETTPTAPARAVTHTFLADTAAAAAAAAAVATASAAQTSPTDTEAASDATKLHAAAAKAAVARSRALKEAIHQVARLQSELNQSRLTLHHVEKQNHELKNAVQTYKEEQEEQKETIEEQTIQITQLVQQVEELRQAQTVLAHSQQARQPQPHHHHQAHQYNFIHQF